MVRSTKVTVRALYIELVSECDQFVLDQCQSYNPPDCRIALNDFAQIDSLYLPAVTSSSPVVQNAHALYLQAHAIYEQAFRRWETFCRERVAAGEPTFTMDTLNKALLNDAADQIDPLLHQAAQLLEGN